MELKKLFKITLLLISDFVSITLSIVLGFYLYTILNIDYSKSKNNLVIEQDDPTFKAKMAIKYGF